MGVKKESLMEVTIESDAALLRRAEQGLGLNLKLSLNHESHRCDTDVYHLVPTANHESVEESCSPKSLSEKPIEFGSEVSTPSTYQVLIVISSSPSSHSPLLA